MNKKIKLYFLPPMLIVAGALFIFIGSCFQTTGATHAWFDLVGKSCLYAGVLGLLICLLLFILSLPIVVAVFAGKSEESTQSQNNRGWVKCDKCGQAIKGDCKYCEK